MSTAGTATPDIGGLAVGIPSDHTLMLVPNEKIEDVVGKNEVAENGTSGHPSPLKAVQNSIRSSAGTLQGGGSPVPFADRAEELGHAPEPYVRDVRAAFSSVPNVRPHWVDRYLKIMVIGESGMGKTTFVKNLFASYTRDADFHVASASGPTSRETFERNPGELCTEIVVEDDARRTRFHYRVQDTPGWECLEDSMDLVLDYLHNCNLKCLEEEQDARRVGPMHHIEDPRVDVCIYFVAPHRVKKLDVRFMTKLSKHVPVVPVLAKADTMTASELAEMRQEVSNALAKAGRDVMHTFSREAVDEARPAHAVPPFAIICSRTMDQSVGRFWPVRKYPWGTCEALSSEHSDFALLKKLLLESCFEELKDETDKRYYKFREQELFCLADPNTGKSVQPRFILNRERKKASPPFHVKAVKWAAAIVITYTAGALMLGGKERLKADAGRAQDIVSDVSGAVKDVAVSAKETIESKIEEKQKPPAPPPRKKVLGIF